MSIRRAIKNALLTASPALGMKCVQIVHSIRARRQSRTFASPRLSRESVAAVTPDWRARIEDVKAAPDNAHIPRVANAGALLDGWITMHNGIEVGALGYYGAGNLNMLMENKGVHEPQEERAFGDVLRHINQDGTMLELGAYWGFYSLWFKRTVRTSRCFLVEPDLGNLKSGEANFARNREDAIFEHAYVGGSSAVAPDGVPIVSVDTFCEDRAIQSVSILHADVQGAELEMLRGASEMLRKKKVDFIFVSTHSNELHSDCIDFLVSCGYEILAEADLDETYSYDGLIVAKSDRVAEPKRLEIHKKGRYSADIKLDTLADSIGR
jgi:FkbM family methyltransferase